MEQRRSGTHCNGTPSTRGNPGAHMVMPREGLRLGAGTDRQGTEYPTLTAARKAVRSGECIVRCSDRTVVAVNGGGS